MKFLKYLFVGMFFGIVLTKSEVISWFRIQEMFLFQSFHMYGVIGSAVLIGIIAILIINKTEVRNRLGEKLAFEPKQKSIYRYLIGGIIFGLGWSLTGSCPGPMYILVGNGILVFIVVIVSALLGTLAYGVLRDKLPH